MDREGNGAKGPDLSIRCVAVESICDPILL